MPGGRIAGIAPYPLKPLTAFAKETVANNRAKARRLITQGYTIVENARIHNGRLTEVSDPETWKEANAKALPFFQQATKIDPQYYLVWIHLGQAYKALKRYQEAITSYQEAVRLEPGAWAAYDQMADIYEKLKEFEAAIEALRQVIRFAPADLFVFYTENQNIAKHPAIQIGDYYLEMRQYGNALAAYKEALRLMPDSYVAYASIAKVYFLHLDDPRAAMEACKQAIRIKPDYDLAHFVLGLAYLDTGNKVLALEEYRILKTLNAEVAQDLYEFIYPR